MKNITSFYRKYSLRTWFYIFAVAFIAWPLLTFFILLALYNGRVAPSYMAPFIEQIPLLAFVIIQLLLQIGLFIVSLMLARQETGAIRRVGLLAVAFIALLFAYRSITGIIGYLDLIT